MYGDIGAIAVFLSWLLAVYAGSVSLYGALKDKPRWVESARNAIIIIFPLLFLACAALVAALLTNDFSLEYVWRVTSVETPTYLKFTALWGGQAGSLLFWNTLLAAFTAAAMMRKWETDSKLMPYAIFVASLGLIFFLSLVNSLENPFARFGFTPAEGNGLNPLLRHPGMIIHPPMLYLGFVGFTIPFAFAMAALITGELDDRWIRTTRRWTLVAWLFLSLGLVLGGRWAYDVLGWGGYWAWDPVENASFMPWLAGTAFLHSVMIQEKRGMFKAWNMFLIILTYLLVVYGTLIVRTGIISSVHSFAQSGIGIYFLSFFAVILIFSAFLVVVRLDKMASPNKLTSLLSREAAFLLNNFVILGILVATFWGTNYPVISELVTGERITVGAAFYEKVNGPLFAILLLLMGIAPLTMWYKTSLQRLGRVMIWPAVAATVIVAIAYVMGMHSLAAVLGVWIATFSTLLTLLEFVKGTRARMRRGENPWTAFTKLMARDRRRYGGYWIHLGVLIMAFGIIGSNIFQQQRQIFLQAGESVTLGDYRAVFNSTETYPGPDDLLITEANLTLYYRDRMVGTLAPRNELYTRSGQPMSIPDLRATIGEDFYILLVNWEGISANAATFKIYLNPLINWVWAGGIIFVLGTLIAAWPDPAEALVSAPARTRRRRAATQAG